MGEQARPLSVTFTDDRGHGLCGVVESDLSAHASLPCVPRKREVNAGSVKM